MPTVPPSASASDARLQPALRRAIDVPLAILELARDAMSVVENVVSELSPIVACEAITAAGLLYTGAESTVAIVRHNAKGLQDQAARDDARERASAAMARVRRSHARICVATDEPD